MAGGKGKGWHEGKDPRSGKAPEHQAAARGKELGNTMSTRMSLTSELIDNKGEAETQLLEKGTNWYNPFYITVGGRKYELNDIIIYKPNGATIHTGKGWFGSNNYLEKGFPVPKAVKRLKPKFDGATFIVPRKKEWHERHDLYPHAVLYVPYSYFDFEFKIVESEYSEGRTQSTPTHISRKFMMHPPYDVPLSVEETDKVTKGLRE